MPTVDAIAYNLYGTGSGRVICPIMDARRSQVYTGIYCFEEDTERFAVLHEQCVVEIEKIASELNSLGKQVIFLGDGVPVYRDRIAELMRVPYTFAPSHLSRQRAGTVAALAMQYWRERGDQCFVDADAFRPEYLRLSQAERERAAGIDTSQTIHRE